VDCPPRLRKSEVASPQPASPTKSTLIKQPAKPSHGRHGQSGPGQAPPKIHLAGEQASRKSPISQQAIRQCRWLLSYGSSKANATWRPCHGCGRGRLPGTRSCGGSSSPAAGRPPAPSMSCTHGPPPNLSTATTPHPRQTRAGFCQQTTDKQSKCMDVSASRRSVQSGGKPEPLVLLGGGGAHQNAASSGMSRSKRAARKFMPWTSKGRPSARSHSTAPRGRARKRKGPPRVQVAADVSRGRQCCCEGGTGKDEPPGKCAAAHLAVSHSWVVAGKRCEQAAQGISAPPIQDGVPRKGARQVLHPPDTRGWEEGQGHGRRDEMRTSGKQELGRCTQDL
jgi:hypothetical protein